MTSQNRLLRELKIGCLSLYVFYEVGINERFRSSIVIGIHPGSFYVDQFGGLLFMASASLYINYYGDSEVGRLMKKFMLNLIIYQTQVLGVWDRLYALPPKIKNV
ncbi:MAG: hypothetical protein VR72_06175 [Clostridiaceae bacterium BRH_c20a]|nr:MAG: hypothetical protein VR72_06175 [Clostridiaceae bacterium BRH_c20a]